MATFNIPSSPKQYTTQLESFLGVDFSSSISEIDKRRSPVGHDFININGTIDKRNGYKILAYLGQKANINGIWNVDSKTGEFFIVHCGNKLYEMKTDFSSYEEILSGMADNISEGLVIDSKLLILDGLRAVVYDLLETTNKVKFLDEIGYIPTTQIARSPDGIASQSYEKVNLVQNSRINLFTSNETDTIYQLDDTNLNSIDKIEVLNNNAEWEERLTGFTKDLEKGQVVFSSAIGKPLVDERDNVRIKYSKNIPENRIQINRCSVMEVYGYAGANDRAFVSGNSECANLVMFSYLGDITYFPADSVIRIGLETVPITGMCKSKNGKLEILKDVSDSDDTIFHIGYATFNGEENFPLEGSTKGEGNISKHAHAVLVNEPLILTSNGVFALNTAPLTDERYVYHRSYYIDTKLKAEANLKEAVGIANDGKYYLAINDNVYVADSRFKTTNSNSRYSNYQYEWYFFTKLPVRVWFTWNNELYFGDKNGNICKFREDNDIDRYLDIDKPVEAEWSSIVLDLNNPVYKKNIKRVAISSNPTSSELIVGYRLKKGDKQVLDKVYNNSSYPKTTIIRKKAKKISYFSVYVENKTNKSMGFNSIIVIYTVGSFYKGD